MFTAALLVIISLIINQTQGNKKYFKNKNYLLRRIIKLIIAVKNHGL